MSNILSLSDFSETPARFLDPRLKPFQVYGAEWLASARLRLLGDQMGTGKTPQTLVAIEDSPIVVCPAVAKGVWARETKKWRPDLTPVILSGRGSFRFPEPGEIVIVNYDILPERLTNAPKKKFTLIPDECHNLKSSKAQKTQRFRMIAKMVYMNGGNIWGLSGSPLMNHPLELWNVLYSLGLAEQAFGSWPNFCRLFGARQGTFGMQWGQPHISVPDLLKRVMLRRLRKEVFKDMKGKQHQAMTVEIDRKTTNLCEELMQMIEDAGINFDDCVDESASTKIGGALFNMMAKVRMSLAVAKIPALLDVVKQFEDNEEPVLVFSAHRAPVDIFEKRPGWRTITGDVAPEERTRIEDAFQAGQLRGVAATIQAGGVSITLTHAHNGVFVDRLFTPDLNAQAEDRMDRFGQKEMVLIQDLVADHRLDVRQTEILLGKQALLDATYGIR